VLLALVFVALLTSTFAAGADAYLEYERSIIGLFRRLAPSVVHVTVEKAASPSDDQSKKKVSMAQASFGETDMLPRMLTLLAMRLGLQLFCLQERWLQPK
jgi:hypothetical protein